MKAPSLNTNQSGRRNRPVVAQGYNTLTTAAGIVTKRTRPMSQARAAAFAKCLSNNRHFADATVQSLSPGSDKFYVCYLPADSARADDVFAQFIQQQAERAGAEMHLYDYKRNDGPEGGWLVKTLPDPKTMARDTWIVDRNGECNCPHYRVRCRKVGAVCKHCIAVASCCTDAEPPPVYAPAHNPVNPWGGWQEDVERDLGASLEEVLTGVFGPVSDAPLFNTTGGTLRLADMTPAQRSEQMRKDFD